MRRTMMTALVGLGAGAWCAPAAAQEAAPCPAVAAPPPELAGWTNRTPLAAAVTDAVPRAVIGVGRGADLALRPVGEVRFAAPPGKAAAAGTYGGLASLVADRPGTYRIALGGAAWIDVVRERKPVESVAHGHGPACSGIRKTVDFRLAPGRYVVQLSGSAARTVAVLVARVP